jgi:hypothetical protein
VNETGDLGLLHNALQKLGNRGGLRDGPCPFNMGVEKWFRKSAQVPIRKLTAQRSLAIGMQTPYAKSLPGW